MNVRTRTALLSITGYSSRTWAYFEISESIDLTVTTLSEMTIVSVLFLTTDAFAIRFYVALRPNIIIQFIAPPFEETIERLTLQRTCRVASSYRFPDSLTITCDAGVFRRPTVDM